MCTIKNTSKQPYLHAANTLTTVWSNTLGKERLRTKVLEIAVTDRKLYHAEGTQTEARRPILTLFLPTMYVGAKWETPLIRCGVGTWALWVGVGVGDPTLLSLGACP